MDDGIDATLNLELITHDSADKRTWNNARMAQLDGSPITGQEEWARVVLVWNGRKQLTSIVVDSKDRNSYRLEDPSDTNSRRIPITDAESRMILREAILSNKDRPRARYKGSGYDLDMHSLHWWFCDDPSLSENRFTLQACERRPQVTERDHMGMLDVTIRVGDMVKVPLNIAAILERSAVELPDDAELTKEQVKQAIDTKIREMHNERVAECYWAHVLAIDNSQTTDGKIELASLLILSPGNLAMLPHNFASEPYAVARSCVFAHYAVADDTANPFMG